MNYKAVNIKINESDDEKVDILVAILDSLNFEGIAEKSNSVIGYIPEDKYDRNILEVSLAGLKGTLTTDIISEQTVEEKNWNEEWEKNFDPVIIDHRCAIRAPFHEPFRNMEYVITISPRMAFGTGHHETTSLMVSAILNMDVKGKTVLDMGCGTGVLGITAAVLGAKEVLGIDNDKWAYENAQENISINNVDMEVLLGSVEQIPEKQFDVILANINRNILIEQAPYYKKALSYTGRLFLSGILLDDVDLIEETFVDIGLTSINHNTLGKWQLLEFVKQES